MVQHASKDFKRIMSSFANVMHQSGLDYGSHPRSRLVAMRRCKDVIRNVAKEVKSAFFRRSDNQHLHSASLNLATVQSARFLYTWLF